MNASNLKKHLLTLSCAATTLVAYAGYGDNSAFAPISTSGTYTVASGVYDVNRTTAGTSDVIEAGPGKNITVNVDSSGDGTLELYTDRMSWILDAYGNYNNSGLPGNITWNGNLIAHMNASATAFTPTEANHANSSLIFNGDYTLDAVNTYNRANWVYSYLVHVESMASAVFNGSMDFSVTTNNNLGAVYSVGVNTYADSGSVSISLGQSDSDSIKIHDIVSNSYGLAWAAGINGEAYEGFNSVIDVKGNAVIENISSVSTDGNAEAVGVQSIADSVINFYADLTVKNITASGSGTAEAYAMEALEGGVINVNASRDRTVKIDGDILAADEYSAINLNLSNADSYLRGGVYELDDGLVNLSLTNGGTWYVIKDSTIHDIEIDGGNIVLEAGVTLYYDNKLSLLDTNGTSSLIFHAASPDSVGKIQFSGPEIEVAQGTEIVLYLSDDFRDEMQFYSLLLIDTSIVENFNIDIGAFNASFIWENGGGEAANWGLMFDEVTGLWAVHIPMIPEPAEYAALLGAITLGFAAYRKKTKRQN